MSVALLRSSSTDAIDKCIAQLAVAFQRHIDPVLIRVYREALSDLELSAVEDAALQLRRKGGTFFPTTAQWHEVAERIMAERTRTFVPTRVVEGPECSECRDTGWGEVERDGKVVCIPCSCRSTNANYQRMTKSSQKVGITHSR